LALALCAAARYAALHPRGFAICAARAALLRITVPLDALRYAFERQTSPGAPKDVLIESHPPGLRLAMTIDTAACPVRVDGVIRIDEVRANDQELRVAGRVSEIRVGVALEADDALPGWLKSAGLGIPSVGTWLRVVPIRPKMIVDARGNQVVLDLLRDDTFAQGDFARRWLPVLTPLVEVRELKTEGDAIVVGLRLRGRGRESWFALRRAARPVASNGTPESRDRAPNRAVAQ